MSKIRVYELAKELGVDNKVVVTKAQELGISGVRSHSNSLQPSEADQIRRSIIRQAIGSRPESEVVRTQVDKTTGEARTVVEKRKGNVIRRRRRGQEETPEDLTEEIYSAEATREEALELQGEQEELAGEEEIPSQTVHPAEESGESLEAEKERTEQRSAPQEALEHREVPPGEPTAPESVVAADMGPAAQTLAEKAQALEPEKKTIGPKVLGKIELPQAAPPKAKKPERKKGAADFSRGTVGVEEGDEDDSKGGRGKKRSKKREFTRHDLVDYEGRGAARRGGKALRGKRRKGEDDGDDSALSTEITTPKASKRIVKMDEVLTVGELANQMSLKSSEVIAKLIELGVMATINQVVDQDTAQIICEEFGFTIESTSFDETEIIGATEEIDAPESLVWRPPVVTVMGHVDHGKTSLLDSIRKSSVVAREHGGITQHIGAYQVETPDGRRVTFIDTPGHAAFTSMRARGAQVTDIVILVVAADDGVMPQTVEAINHAKAAQVPIIVAVNKMDKPDANPDRVKQQLSERGLQPEDWGGDTMFVPVSALKGDGISDLLEGVLLQAEIAELKANPDKGARGRIIESRQEIGKGTVATVLIQSGTLRIGDVYVSGAEYGRVRSMTDYKGEKLEEAGPSCPVEITGVTGAPEAGDDFIVVESESKARQVAEFRLEKKRKRDASNLAGGPISLEEFTKQARAASVAELNLIVKADVHGSLEAVREASEKLSTEKVRVKVIHGGVGAVNESDVQLAIASRALIVGFNVRAEPRAMGEAEKHGIEVRFYRIIYELLDEVKLAMAGLLEPIKREKPLGKVEVRETFSVPKLGRIAGGYVLEGIARRGSMARLLRDSSIVHEGRAGSLRRFKDDVKEVQSGYECGISIEGYNDVKVGDIIELFEIEEVAATLD